MEPFIWKYSEFRYSEDIFEFRNFLSLEYIFNFVFRIFFIQNVYFFFELYLLFVFLNPE